MSSQKKQRPSLREQQRLMTRTQLIDAAVDRFAEFGYSSTSVSDITAAAGATRATFYLHFKSKADIVFEILDDLDRQYVDVFDELVDVVAKPSVTGIRSWLEGSVGIWKTTRPASVAVSDAAAVESAVAERRSSSFDHNVIRVSDALQSEGKWNTGQSVVRAVLILTQLEQLFLRWSARGGELDTGDAVDVLTSMWSAALGVTEA